MVRRLQLVVNAGFQATKRAWLRPYLVSIVPQGAARSSGVSKVAFAVEWC
jgi:hypothetical protein